MQLKTNLEILHYFYSILEMFPDQNVPYLKKIFFGENSPWMRDEKMSNLLEKAVLSLQKQQ